MKVEIESESPANGDRAAFTSLEYVRGVIDLTLLRQQTVSRVTVTLQGRLEASIVAKSTNAQDSTLHAVDKHKLFKTCQMIFPPPDVPSSSKAYTLPSGVTKFPFEIRFPVLSACKIHTAWINHLSTSLPPSFKFQASKDECLAEVRYWLRVKVERPGRFKKDLAVSHELRFLPLDPILPPPMFDPICGRSVQVFCTDANNSASTGLNCGTPLRGDRHNKHSSFLEATLPSPAILCLGNKIPLRLSIVTIPAPSGKPPPIILRSVTLAIQTENGINVGANAGTWVSATQLLKLSSLESRLSPYDNAMTDRFELDDELWKDLIVRDVSPSFTTCTARQEHILVVTAGVSFGDERKIHLLKASINVEIHSGIRPAPTRRAGDESDEGVFLEERPFVPWRIGSERHLGILRQAVGGARDTPPPPY